MGEINRVPSKLLRNLDAKLHQSEILTIFERIEKLGSSTIERLGMRVTKGTTPTTIGHQYQDSGIMFIRSQNVLENEISGDFGFISEECNTDMKRSEISKGDLLLNIVGASIGRCAVFNLNEKANTNQAVALIKNNDAVDSHYASTWVNSKLMQKIISAQQSGNARDNFDLYQVREIEIPTVTEAIQKYIGDKVRQAEQLRAWGKIQSNTATSLFDKLVFEFGYVSRPNKQSVWAKLDNRLDPAYYAPQYSFLNESWFTSRCKPLSTYIEDGAYGVLPDSNSYGSGDQKFIRATDIKLSNIDPTAFTFVPADQVTLKARVKTNDILLEIKGAIEACELAGRDLEGTYVNGSIYRFTPKEIAPGYLAFYLRSFVKQLYCQRVSVNNIISYLDLGSISNLPVVRFGQENEDLIEQSFLQQLDAARLSFRLTTAAKFLVEALIEGQLTEADLIAAEQALQTGNDQLDHQILNRLKTDGIDGQGQPLFSDLDQLYSLLQQANHS